MKNFRVQGAKLTLGIGICQIKKLESSLARADRGVVIKKYIRRCNFFYRGNLRSKRPWVGR